MRTLTCWICTLGLAGGLVFGVFEQVAEADVYVDSSDTKALADIGMIPSPPYLLGSSYSGQDYWFVPAARDATTLVGAGVVEAEAEATFLHPYEQTPIAPPFSANTLGNASYTASHGELRASADATASLFPSSYVALSNDFEDPPIEIRSPYLTGTFAGIKIAYDDEVTVTSSTLPQGTAVQIEVELRHDDAVTSTAGLGGGPPFPNQAFSETRLELGIYDFDYSVQKVDQTTVWRDENTTGVVTRDDPNAETYPFGVAIGDHLAIYQTLQVWARATADADFSTAAASANASNTAGLSIRSLTPGVVLESTSGRDYTISVPEPGLAASAGAGMLALLLRWRRLAARRARRVRTGARRPGMHT
ncbi:MAG: hypothetical protein MUF70_09230 [Myxococcota bacterium]|nr:hypothetical protein [Myxococcota bacterium]